MLWMIALASLAGGVIEGPEPEDVKAGPIALVVFVLLGLAVAFLGWSLVRQLRKAQAAKDAGVYGDEPVERPAAPDEPDAAGDRGPEDRGAGGTTTG
jgi:hypothetical protein